MAEVRGAFFQPGIGLVIDAYCHKAEDKIANNAQAWIHKLQQVYFQNPTGYYARHIAIRDMGIKHIVHDSNVVYGPWLEGFGSRNYPQTRFRGYSIFRKVAQEMDRQITGVTDQAMREACRVINR